MISKALFFLIFISVNLLPKAYGKSLETYICILNRTKTSVSVLVDRVKNVDWDGVSRPDHNWNGVVISPAENLCRRAEINPPGFYSGDVIFDFIFNGEDQTTVVYPKGFARDFGWVTTSNWANDYVLSGGGRGSSNGQNWMGIISGTSFAFGNYLYGRKCPREYSQETRLCTQFDLGPVDLR